MKPEIYGWHIIHTATGFPYAFCCRYVAGEELTESDVLGDLDQNEFTLIPLARIGVDN